MCIVFFIHLIMPSLYGSNNCIPLTPLSERGRDV